MIKVNPKKKTDEAWQRLYARFEKDDLLPVHKPRRLYMKWQAAVAAMLVGVAFILTFLLMPDGGEDNHHLLTQENSEITTLVKTLEDGSVVYLTQASTLQYPEHFSAEKRLVNLQGEAFFDIARNPEQTFLIETDKVRVEVLGTAFDVKSNEKYPFSLSVLRGRVKVSMKQGGQPVFANAGQTVTLKGNGLQLSANTPAGYFDRYTNNIRFKDECLEDVLRVINKKSSDYQIETASSVLNKRRLTVEFSDNSPETVAELISLTFNLKCSKQGNKLVLSE